MSEKLEKKFRKGDQVELLGKEYEVAVSGASQLTLKDIDGKQRRVTHKSTAYSKIKLISESELEEVPEEEAKKPKKRLGKKTEVKEEVKEIDFDKFEQESFKLIQDINPEDGFYFSQDKADLYLSWCYSIQRATKAQRIAFIEYKLAKEGNDSLFGLMLALYKTRQEIKVDYEDFEDRILIDEFAKGKRAKSISIRNIQGALKPMINVSRNKVTQEMKDELIKVIPDNDDQAWILFFLNRITSWGTLKLSVQDLSNIKIPMA